MSGRCGCGYCASPAPDVAVVELGHEPVELPAVPRAFRVHTPGRPPQDCTLHPDGRMTMQHSGQELTSMLSFDDMRGMTWRCSHIEWDPEPLAQEPEPEQVSAPVQEAIAL